MPRNLPAVPLALLTWARLSNVDLTAVLCAPDGDTVLYLTHPRIAQPARRAWRDRQRKIAFRRSCLLKFGVARSFECGERVLRRLCDVHDCAQRADWLGRQGC